MNNVDAGIPRAAASARMVPRLCNGMFLQFLIESLTSSLSHFFCDRFFWICEAMLEAVES